MDEEPAFLKPNTTNNSLRGAVSDARIVAENDLVEPGFPLKGRYLFGPKSNGDHWQTCLEAVERYDNDKCQGWREDIDTLLVFAGLFTAIVTSFTMESSKWLQPNQVERTNLLILDALRQLNNASADPLPYPSVQNDFTPSASAVRINCFWFLSITVSLAAGVTGILCKQWMREFQRDAALPPEKALALRQLRYLGWKRWYVPQLISSPALLLQLSLLLFLGGLLDMLWTSLHSLPVAFCATIVVALTALLMFMTTLLPAFSVLWQELNTAASTESSQCPYRSPQSFLFLKFILIIYHLFNIVSNRVYMTPSFSNWLTIERRTLDREVQQCGSRGASSMDATRSHQMRSLALQWIQRTLAFNKRVRDNLFHCLQDSWRTCSNGKQHLYHQDTHQDCRRDFNPGLPLFILCSERDHAFDLEVVLRSVVQRRQEGLDFPSSSSDHLALRVLKFETPSESKQLPLDHRSLYQVPPILESQTLRCLQVFLEGSGRSTTYLFRCAFRICLHQPTYDDRFVHLLNSYSKILATSEQRQALAMCFVRALSETQSKILAHEVLHFRRVDLHQIQDRPIFIPLINVLKQAGEIMKLSEREERDLYDKLKVVVLQQTSVSPTFFASRRGEHPGNQSLLSPHNGS